MASNPLVSIVTCTYNRAHLIDQTIRSVLSQTWQLFEYVIVDDGSTDNTKAVVDSFVDSRLKYFFHEHTHGHLSRLRNFAHLHCSGELIAYVDSDDLWEPDKLRRQVSGMMKNPSAGFSFTDIQTFDENGIIRSSLYNKAPEEYLGSVFEDMLNNSLIICHTTLLIRRSSMDKTGPMDETMHSGDHDTVFFLSRYFDAYVIYQPLVRVRKHEGNSTSNAALNLELLQEHHRTLKKLYDKKLIIDREYQRALAVTSYSFGFQLIAAGDFDSASTYFLKSWQLRPWHLKSAIRTLVTLAKKKFG